MALTGTVMNVEDRGPGPRAMAYREWEDLMFCIDCKFETVVHDIARHHLAATNHRVMKRKRHKVDLNPQEQPSHEPNM